VNSEAPGCLVIPALIVVVPLRLLWEVLSAIGRFAGAYLLRPLGWLLYHGVVRPLGWLLYHGVVRPLGWLLYHGVVRPLGWLLRVLVLIPLRWIGATIIVPFGRLILRYLLRPVWLALAWMGVLLLTPFLYVAGWIGRGLAALWRLLRPVLVATARFIAHAWRLAGVVLFHVLVRPAVWIWQNVVMPVLRGLRWTWRAVVVPLARWLRTHVGEPVRAAARSVFKALGLD
jgi:hypothetical protein